MSAEASACQKGLEFKVALRGSWGSTGLRL